MRASRDSGSSMSPLPRALAVQHKRRESWRALEAIFAGGKARAIGVSNYLVPHLRELLGEAKVVPHVNQIELTPFLPRRETRALCKEHQIVVEAYSPLSAAAARRPIVRESRATRRCLRRKCCSVGACNTAT